MRNISDTIARLSAAKTSPLRAAGGAARLIPLHDFGDNPGALKAWSYLPAGLGAGAPLVVVLHGCTQTAAGYDTGAGWSRLADRHGFALLFPEQDRANNANLCFNWFVPGDCRRGEGEPLSIRNMVARMVADHQLDTGRVFVTGLSAGGAMTAVMLATYPDVFAGGAIIAGLPHGTAATMPEAFDRMRGHGLPGSDQLAALARAAAGRDGPWPTLSIWHGDVDHTVAAGNADAIGGQWRALHNLPDLPSVETRVDGSRHQLWQDAAGRSVLEDHRIPGMGHGVPIAPRLSADGGASGPFMLDVGIPSSHLILRFWGLETDAQVVALDTAAVPEQQPAAAWPNMSVGTVIEDALRSAGLMR